MATDAGETVGKEAPPVEKKKKGLALLKYDIQQKSLIPVKILFLVVMASIGVLLPYMTIHMKSLGITVQETAVIYGVYPLFSILAPGSTGMIGDKIGNFNVLLSVMFVACAVNALLFLAVPTAREFVHYPANLSLAVGCSSPSLVLHDLDSRTCLYQQNGSSPMSLTLTGCGYVCYEHELRAESRPEAIVPAEWLPNAESSIRSFWSASLLPDGWNLNVSCAGDVCRLDQAFGGSGAIRLEEVEFSGNWTIGRFKYNGRSFSRFQCDSYDEPVRFHGNAPARYRHCRAQCIAQVPRGQFCANAEDTIVYNPQLTFWSYMILRVLLAVILGGAMILFEGACLAVVIEVQGDLGLQRMFGVIGMMIFSPVSGVLIDFFSVEGQVPNFKPAFYLYGAMAGAAAAVVLCINLDFRPPAKSLFKDIKVVLRSVELDVFFIVHFMSGLFWGYIESYLFWFLEDMGGTKSLMGLTLTVSALSGIPALLVSDYVFRKIGHPNVQVIGFIFYIFRLFGYSYITEPSMCLIFETMEAVTTSLMVTSAVAYSAELGTATTLATIQGIVGGIYYGMGRGAGSFIGGFLMKAFGTRSTFRILAVTALFTAAAYFLFNVLYIRPRRASAAARKATETSADSPAKLENGAAPAKNGVVNPVYIADESNGKT